MGKTNIEWTGSSWNPIRARNLETGGVGHYCEKVSPGCAGCYAARMQKRFKNHIRYNAADRGKVQLFLDEDVLQYPLRWRKPQNIFVCSMTDLFGGFVPDEWLDRIFTVMALAPRHTFQILTKRPERMRSYLAGDARLRALRLHQCNIANSRMMRLANRQGVVDSGFAWPLPNVHLGVSVENQETADERIPLLLQTPADVRWISAEPLLGPLNIEPFLINRYLHGSDACHTYNNLDWVVVGGESGPGARPCDISNIRSVVEQCRAASVPCFVKQLGSKPFMGVKGFGPVIRDRKGGDIEEFPIDLRVREFPIPQTEGIHA